MSNKGRIKFHTMFDDGSMLLSSYGKVFHVTKKGKRVYDESISFTHATQFKVGFAIVTNDANDTGIIDTTGKYITTKSYDYISDPEGFICEVIENGEAYHILVNICSDDKITPMYEKRFDFVTSFVDGIAIATKNGKEFHIGRNGKCIYSKKASYDFVTEFTDGVATAIEGLNIHTINKHGSILSTRLALTE